MYIPAAFNEQSPQIAFDLIEEIRLGSLITQGRPMLVSHIPFMVDRDRGDHGTLIGHVSKANPQWEHLTENAEVLATFLGPNAYISPSWYATSPRAPTWTYISVHVYGKATLVRAEPELTAMVARLSNTMEPSDSSWSFSGLPEAHVAKLVKGIVGFEITITRIETQLRLGQNNSVEDRRRVGAALTSRNGLNDSAVSKLMSRFSFRDHD